MEEKSALTIQKHWRGYRERKNFCQQRPSLTEYKAAVPLQRAVLKFLAKCRKKKKLFASWHGLQELTDASRVELKQQVDDYVRRHPGSEMSDVASRELHAQAQEQLQRYFMGRAVEERTQQHREALMAQISTNIEQLMKMLGLLTGLTSTIVHELSKYGVDQIMTSPSEAELPHKSDMELNNTIPDNVLERLSDAEKLVVELKEIIQQKDLQLLQQDEVLQEERKAADTKIKKLKLHAKSKLVSLNKQMEKLKAQGEAASPMDPQAAEPLSEV
ncbi:IQ calmodulin-binding motif-containing protein 1-like isoform X1 [Onychomys torridus]|nr:IQ calmodulin-binding motif-containing protein 1-like isoform X1 [Onychomys torridus]